MSLDWTRRRVGDFATRVKDINTEGVELPPLSVTKDRGVMLQSEKFKKRIATDLRKYVVARRGQFAFDPMSLYYGSIGRIDAAETGVVSPDYVVFETDGSVDGSFLDYLLRSKPLHDQYATLAEGGNQVGKRRRVYWSVFEDIRLRLPDLRRQKKIAAILSSVDEAIQSTQAVVDQLQVVKKAMMGELLTRGLPGCHTKFEDTSIGALPIGWRAKRVGEVLRDTSYGTSAKCDVSPDGAPVLRIPNVVSERVTFDELKYAQLPSSEICRYRVEAGDLLMIRTNGNPAYVGRTAVVPPLVGDWLYASYLIRLRVDNATITPEFLHEALRSVDVRSTMEGAIRTSAGNYNLNTGGIANTVVPLPPVQEQVEIVRAARYLEDRIDAEVNDLHALSDVKSALLSVLLTGEVRVTPAPEAP